MVVEEHEEVTVRARQLPRQPQLSEVGGVNVYCKHTATHCNTLQYTATHCNTLQHTAIHCKVGGMYVWCSVVQCGAVCCVYVCYRVLQCVAVSCRGGAGCCSVSPTLEAIPSMRIMFCVRVLQCVAVWCSVVQCGAVCRPRCSVVQCIFLSISEATPTMRSMVRVCARLCTCVQE